MCLRWYAKYLGNKKVPQVPSSEHECDKFWSTKVETCHVHIFFLSSTAPTAEQFSSTVVLRKLHLWLIMPANTAAKYNTAILQ